VYYLFSTSKQEQSWPTGIAAPATTSVVGGDEMMKEDKDTSEQEDEDSITEEETFPITVTAGAPAILHTADANAPVPVAAATDAPSAPRDFLVPLGRKRLPYPSKEESDSRKACHEN
jgi:hypothetical protein